MKILTFTLLIAAFLAASVGYLAFESPQSHRVRSRAHEQIVRIAKLPDQQSKGSFVSAQREYMFSDETINFYRMIARFCFLLASIFYISALTMGVVSGWLSKVKRQPGSEQSGRAGQAERGQAERGQALGLGVKPGAESEGKQKDD